MACACTAVHAQQGAAGAGESAVTLHLLDIAGQQFVPAFEVHETLNTALRIEDLKDPAAFAAALRSGQGAMSAFLLARLSPALRQRLAAGGPPGGDLLDALVSELNGVLRQGNLYDPKQFGQGTLPADVQAAVNAVGRAGAKATDDQRTRANRYLLESAYPGLIAASHSLASKTPQDRWAQLPAGTYWLVPTAYPRFSARVTVKAGQRLDAEARAANAIVLNFKPDAKTPAAPLLLTLKTKAQMQAAIAGVRREDRLRTNVAFPRTGATAKETAAALELARRNLPRYSGSPSSDEAKGLSEAQVSALRGKYWQPRAWAEWILAAHGESGDADLLAESTPPRQGGEEEAACTIAYLEARLGTLEHGRLMSALRGSDPVWAMAAAAELHDWGIRAGDAKLVAFIENPAPNALGNAELPAYALLDSADPAVLPAMKGLLAATKRSPGFCANIWQPGTNAVTAAILYVLAYGSAADYPSVCGLELGTEDAPFLAFVTDDPTPLAIFDIVAKNLGALMRLSPSLRTLPGRSEALAQLFERAVYLNALAQYTQGAGSLEQYESERPMHDVQLYMSFWRPHDSASTLLACSAGWDRMPEGNFPLPWHVDWDDGTANWLGWPLQQTPVSTYIKYAWRTVQLDYFPRDEIARRFGALAPADRIAEQDMFLAAYAATTQAFYTTNDYYHDGVERRPYGLHHVGGYLDKGALSGVLELRPALSGSRLSLNLRVNQVAHYSIEKMYDAFVASDYTLSRYDLGDGRGLISAVRVSRAGTALPVTENPAAGDHTFTFTADLGRPDLGGVYADVEFKFYDQTWDLVYDLFASDLARQLRH